MEEDQQLMQDSPTPSKKEQEKDNPDEEKHCFPYYDFTRSLMRRFDGSFLIILIFENINFGLWILISLEYQDLFKTYLDQDPGDAAVYNSIIAIPFSIKVFFGIISDNVKIFGLRRKPYLIFFAFVQAIVMFCLFYFNIEDVIIVVLLLTLASLTNAFSNVVIEAILVVQARKDPEMGSQDLFSVSFFFQSLAGIIGCVVAAFMMENYHPRWAFLVYGIFGFLLGILCFFLNSEAEKEAIEDYFVSEYSSEILEGQTPSEAQLLRQQKEAERPPPGEEGCCYNFVRNMKGIGWAIKRWEIYFVLIYFILDGITNPSFSDFTYYFLMNVVGLSKLWFALLTLIGQVCMLIGVVIYELLLKSTEVRTILLINVILVIIGAWMSYMFAMRWNLDMGISDYAFLIFTDVVFGAITTAFNLLPIMTLLARITPKRIEGTMFAFLTGVSNLDQGVIQPLMGAWINSQFVGVTKDDLSGYPTLMLISFFTAFLGFALLPLIPKKADIDESNEERALQEKKDNQERSERKRQRLEQRQANKEKKQQDEQDLDEEGGENERLIASKQYDKFNEQKVSD